VSEPLLPRRGTGINGGTGTGTGAGLSLAGGSNGTPPAALAGGPGLEAAVFDPLAVAFDRFTAVWDRIDTRFSDWLTQQLPDTAGRALDLGCGAGRHTALLAERYPDVLAVDPSGEMLDLAETRLDRPGVTYQQRDGIDLSPRVDGLFELVLSVHTLHHLGPAEQVLPLVKDLVAPGGTAVLVDIVNPGDWTTPDWHITRAFTDAENAYRASLNPTDPTDILRLLLHPDWLAMTTRDTPLTRTQFHHHYSHTFPGARFVDDLHPLMAAALWHRPAAIAATDQPAPAEPDAARP
jgi:SAM-dependent methyltransferase